MTTTADVFRAVLWAAATLLITSTNLPGSDGSWARNGRGFEGTFRVHLNQSGEGQMDEMTSKWSIQAEVNGRFRLDTWDADRDAWTGTIEGTASFNHNFKNTIPGCVITMTVKGTTPLKRPPDATPHAVYLYLRENGTYILSVDYGSVAVPSTTTGVCEYGSDTTVLDAFESWYPEVYPSKAHPAIPAEAGPLTFNGIVSDSINVQWPLSFKRNELLTEFPTEISWDLRPIGSEDKLEVVVSDNFEAFRPRAAIGGGKGDSVTLTARLRTKDGSELDEKAKAFKWSFTQVSHEPGYALNVPIVDPGTDADLQFEPGGNVNVQGDDGQAAQTDDGEWTESSAVAGSYDWGAYGRIRVVATMADGREIVGYLEGDKSQTEIRLPKRAEGDLIAKSWRDAKGVGDKSDHADDDDAPVGDGNKGDGLSLYEEYRGFLENSTHIEGDPFRKDYFAVNLGGGVFGSGLQLFAKLTGLAVHGKLTGGEVAPDRVINRNHGSAHLVDQHGVKIVPDATIQGYAEARGGPGNPGRITEIAMPAFTGNESAQELNYMSSSLVHELLHSVNVYHHGEQLELHVQWAGNPVDGYKEIENGVAKQIRILREDGSAYDRDLGNGREFTLGQYDSPYSGDAGCIMKYDAARGYKALADPDLRYRADETSGIQLCSDTKGTGTNDAQHNPQSRYGDAAPGRGNCKGQILVNDGVQAPRR